MVSYLKNFRKIIQEKKRKIVGAVWDIPLTASSAHFYPNFAGLAVLFKVLITCRFNDKIFVYHFLVHEGCMIMMFFVLQEPKSDNPKFYH